MADMGFKQWSKKSDKRFKKLRKNKYSAQRVEYRGKEFPSKLEAAVYGILLLRERAGEIRDIHCQSTVLLKEKCPQCGDGPIKWKVDFSFDDTRTGERVYCEAKGVETESYRKKKALWKQSPPAKLEVWKGSYRSPELVEVIHAVKKTEM